MVTSLTSFSHMKVNQFADIDGTALTNGDSIIHGTIDSYSDELRASGDIGRISYIFGLSYAHDNARTAAEIDIPYSTNGFVLGPVPATLNDKTISDQHQRFDTQAVFGNIDYHLTDRLTAHGGLRFTSANLHYDACSLAGSVSNAAASTIIVNMTRATLGLPALPAIGVGQCTSINPITSDLERYYNKLDEENLSWHAGLDWKPNSHTLVYATVSRGYKAGSSSTAAAVNDLAFLPASQESVIAYELGLKASMFDRKAELTAAAFYDDYRNKQVQGRMVFTPNLFGPINTLVNVPKSAIKGAEAQLTLFPVAGLTLTAAGTYLDSRVTGSFVTIDTFGVASDFNGNAFPFTPKWQLVFDSNYRFPVSERTNVVLGANASYRSSTVSGFGGNSLLDIDAYWLVDARAGLEFSGGKYRIQAFGKNITNQYYWTNATRSVDNVRRYAGMPVTYGVQVSVRY